MLTRIIISVCGVAVVTVGAISLAGYVLGIPRMYGWLDGGTVMPINTALAFVLVGLALALLGASDRLWGTIIK